MEVIQTPEIQTSPTAVAQPAPGSSFEDGGSFQDKKPVSGEFKMVDILIMALWIVSPIYVISSYRNGIKKLDVQPSSDGFDNMSGDIDEVKYSLKKALGKKYKIA